MSYTLQQNHLDGIENILKDQLPQVGIHCVLFIDMAGNIIAEYEAENTKHDIPALAALSAANFGAVNALAKMIGEEDFSVLFNKGERENIHFSKVLDEFLLVCIFDNEVSLGLLRLKIAKAIGKITEILKS
ncbi:Roadblock/LC7 family protein [uncultured Desulfobacterium sp.]|uniref:Roadblock/LC7 family protein n=1 Tax=uncultured Desulfobacterium sp. TaxID=201089 RepID=A0A445MRG4_9BACT|nr:Roadblock/LC7 family protein [uncultured Desulfobacterium sp.]